MNDTTKPSEYLGYWGEKYKNDLLTDILPFWLKSVSIMRTEATSLVWTGTVRCWTQTSRSGSRDGSPLFSLMLTTTSKNRPNGWKPVKTGSTLSRNIVSIQTAACFTR